MGGCGNGRSGIIDWIGDDYWFKTYVGQSSGYKAGVNCFGNKPEEVSANKMVNPNSFAPRSIFLTKTILPYNKNQWSRYSPGTSPPVVSPPLPPVTIKENCGGSGWSKQLTGPNVFNSGTDYLPDVSYIQVPDGVTVVISYNGRSFTIVGPRHFNACGGSGDWHFNDKMSTIDIRSSSS